MSVLLKSQITRRLDSGVKASYLRYSGEKARRIATVTGFTLTDGIETTHRKYKDCVGDLIKFEGNNNVKDLDFKLVLRPWDQLTTKIVHKGEEITVTDMDNSDPYKYIAENCDNWCDAYEEALNLVIIDRIDYGDYTISQLPYEIVQLFISLHFVIDEKPDQYIKVTDKFNVYKR